MNKCTLPGTYLRYLQYGKKTQRKMLPGLIVSKTEKEGISLVSIDESKLPSIFKGNKILPDALRALNLISQLPEEDAEKDRMALEIHRHILILAAKKSSFELLLDKMPYFSALGLATVFLTFMMGPFVLLGSIIAGLLIIIKHDEDMYLQERHINKAFKGLKEVMAIVNIKFSNSTSLSFDASEEKLQNLANERIMMQDSKQYNSVRNISPSLAFFPNKNVESASTNGENSFTERKYYKSS